MPKMKPSCHDWSTQVPFMIKTKQDNDVTDRIGVDYIKNNTDLSWLIGYGANCDENQIA